MNRKPDIVVVRLDSLVEETLWVQCGPCGLGLLCGRRCCRGERGGGTAEVDVGRECYDPGAAEEEWEGGRGR